MTTEDKLQHFLNFCIEDARNRSNKMLDEYTAALEQTLEEHQADARRRAEHEVSLESDKIERDANKRLSLEQINIKRELGQKQDELKDKLFVELRNELALFMSTADYISLLENQIRKAMEFSDGSHMIIYIDPADEQLMNQLALRTGAALELSEYSFLGGTRALIPSRHILIDNSFQTKLQEAKQEFRLDLSDLKGGEYHE